MVDQAEIHRKVHSNRAEDRREAARLFSEASANIQDTAQAWQDLIELTGDEDSFVRRIAAESLYQAFPHVANREMAWKDLIKLTDHEDLYVRWRAARSVVPAFSHVPNNEWAWQYLHKLAGHDDRAVRMYAYYSLGKASVYKAVESEDIIVEHLKIETYNHDVEIYHLDL